MGGSESATINLESPDVDRMAPLSRLVLLNISGTLIGGFKSGALTMAGD